MTPEQAERHLQRIRQHGGKGYSKEAVRKLTGNTASRIAAKRVVSRLKTKTKEQA